MESVINRLRIAGSSILLIAVAFMPLTSCTSTQKGAATGAAAGVGIGDSPGAAEATTGRFTSVSGRMGRAGDSI